MKNLPAMSALPYGSSFPQYSSATLPYNTYSAAPTYAGASIYDASGTYQSYPTATASYSTYAPMAPISSAAPSKPQTVIVKKYFSDIESLDYHRNNVRSVEESVVFSYQELERLHVKLNQLHSEAYGQIFHTETQEMVKFYQKLDTIKHQLSQPILDQAVQGKCFPDPIIPPAGFPAQQQQVQQNGGAGAPPKKHPMLELKALQLKVRDLRILLQTEVDKL